MHLIDRKDKEDKTASGALPKDRDPSQVLQALKENTAAHKFFTDIKELLVEFSMNDFLWVFQGQNEKIKNLNKDGICYALTVDWLALCIQGEPFKITAKFKDVDIFKQYNELQLKYQGDVININKLYNEANIHRRSLDDEILQLEKTNKSFQEIRAEMDKSAFLSETNLKALLMRAALLYGRFSKEKVGGQQNNLKTICDILAKLLAQKEISLKERRVQYDKCYNAIKLAIQDFHSKYYNLRKVKLSGKFTHESLRIDAPLDYSSWPNTFESDISNFKHKFANNGIYHVGITFKTKDTTYGHVIAVYINKNSIYFLDANSGGFKYTDDGGDMEVFWEFFVKYFSALQRYSDSRGYKVEGDTLTSWTN